MSGKPLENLLNYHFKKCSCCYTIHNIREKCSYCREKIYFLVRITVGQSSIQFFLSLLYKNDCILGNGDSFSSSNNF